MNIKKALIIPVVFYSASLMSPVFNQPGETIYGMDILLTGWIQSFLGLLGVKTLLTGATTEFEEYLSFAPLIFPWFGNAGIVLGISCASINDYKLSKLCASIGAFCIAIFWLKPMHIMGSGIKAVEFEPLVGAYFWSMSLLSLLFLLLCADDLNEFRQR